MKRHDDEDVKSLNTKWMSVDELARYLSVSPITAKRFASGCGAEVKITARCVRYDREVIDAELARRQAEQKRQAALTAERTD